MGFFSLFFSFVNEQTKDDKKGKHFQGFQTSSKD
ncbi:hypothetical protein CLW00_105235 [Mongoliibacter ruber]|uniref:Uncharacterized protein n=1 Tax=Mongoliibacter ruber TaxID=1750599 RepID=A0A2T0WNM3_9BACT|nr:hypothetical protein CLW00_105235 [Mongoliibacter ruber]